VRSTQTSAAAVAAVGLMTVLLSGCSLDSTMTTSNNPSPAASQTHNPWTYATAKNRAVDPVAKIEAEIPRDGFTTAMLSALAPTTTTRALTRTRSP
jgi:hypothetical protein